MITKPFMAMRTARHTGRAFTLVEMLISIVVLALLILTAAQVMNTAATVVRPANKHIDTDTEARVVFDRMAADFGKMLKRSDIDYWLKQQGPRYYPGHSFGHSQGQGHRPGSGQQGSDQIAFFSQVPGYYPSSGSQSPLSLVAYRVNTTTYQLERMAKGLLWNAASYVAPGPTGNPTSVRSPKPMVFLPLTISTMWPYATDFTSDGNTTPPAYETIGPNTFRFEYYYLMKDGSITDNPWKTGLTPPHTLANFPTDVEAIVVAIAVIDPASRSLLTYDPNNPNSPNYQHIIDLVSNMNDFRTQQGRGPIRTGVIEAQWNSVVTTNAAVVPQAANQAIRIYSRYFDLKTL